MLALEHLLELLREDRLIRTVAIEQLDAQAGVKTRNLVFVIDNFGLELPLSQVLRNLRLQFKTAKFVILDRQRLEADILRMLWFGIHGFLTHAEVGRNLLSAVHCVAEGRMWMAAHLLHTYVLHAHYARGGNQRTSLTQREEQVLELVKRRFSNREIGEMLGIKESTVKFHLCNLLSKMHARNRHDLASSREALYKWAAFLPPSVAPAKPS